MKEQYVKLMKNHISDNKYKYLISVMVIVFGALIGILFANNTEISENDINSFSAFVSVYKLQGVININILKNSFAGTFQLLILLYISAYNKWLFPLNYISIFTKGFGIGFPLTYLLRVGGTKGLWVAISSALFQNLILLPALIVYSVIQVNCFVKRKSHLKERKSFLIDSVITILIFIAITLISCVFEAGIIPPVISIICGKMQ